MRAPSLEYSLFDRLAIAGPSDRKNSYLPRKGLLKPVACLERIVCRSVLHKEDFSQDNSRWQVLDKRHDKGLQIECLVVHWDHDAVFHQSPLER